MNPRIFLLVIGTFATGTSSLIVAGILPEVARGLHTTQAAAGLSVTATAIAYAVSAPILPALLARFERRTIMAISLTGFVAANVGAMLVGDLTWFIVMRVLVGIASAAFTPQASSVAVALVDADHRGRAITSVLLGTAGASALGVPLGTLVGSAWGYHAAFALVALLGVAGLIGLLGIPKTARPVATGIRAQLAPLGRPAVLAIAGTTALLTTGFFTVSIYFAPLFKATAGLDASGVALAFGAFGAAGVVSLLIGGRFIDRFGGFRVTFVASIVVLAGTLLLGVAPSLLWILVVIVPWGLFGNISIPAQQLELGRLDPDNPAPVYALNLSSLFVGTALGGAIGSAAVDRLPARDLVLIAAIPLVLAVVASGLQVMRATRRERAVRAQSRAMSR